MERLYPEGFFFQQDGNPCHKSKESMKYINENFDNLLYWPPYSPDVSPIENIWAWLKEEVAKDQPK